MATRRIAGILKWLAIALGVLVVGSLALGLYLFSLSRSLPDLQVDPNALKTARTSFVYAADGRVIAEWHGEQDRRLVAFSDMPQFLKQAVIAVEDKRFYTHTGVDPHAVARALKIDIGTHDAEQGGSTITQQLVKILFTNGQRTFTRKVREALMAYQLEAKVPKDKVLETYLNTVYFGHGAYGVEAASRKYFGQSVSSLDLSEAALLAGIIKSPAGFDPVAHPAAAKARRDLVLSDMLDQGYIDKTQEQQALKEQIKVALPADTANIAPYFVEWVKQDLIHRLGSEEVYAGGLRVYTTLDPTLQSYADTAVKVLPAPSDPEVALVSIQPSTGRVLAMEGGRDFGKHQFNLAVQGRRQPGSSFKPFLLVAALQQGVRPDQVFDATPYDARVKDGIWHVKNYESQGTAPALTLRAATTWSVNCVFARLMMAIGPQRVVEVARKMGITSPLNADPAIALGGLKYGVSPLEMASAYGTLADSGVHVAPSGILKVTDDHGRVLYEPKPVGTRAVDKPTATTAALMLHDVVQSGTGINARIAPWAAGKTGTTESYRDAWFVGWSGDLVTAVWVGNRAAQVAMTNVHGIRVTGGSFPAQAWKTFMTPAVAERSAPLTPRAGATASADSRAVLVKICLDTMDLANPRCPNTTEIWLDPSLVPRQVCTRH